MRAKWRREDRRYGARAAALVAVIVISSGEKMTRARRQPRTGFRRPNRQYDDDNMARMKFQTTGGGLIRDRTVTKN